AALHGAEQRAAEWSKLSSDEKWERFLDEHPSDPLRLSLHKAALAWLELERGDFSEEYTPLSAAKVEVDGREISLDEIGRSATHHSPVMASLESAGWRRGASCRENARALLRVCREFPQLDSRRAR